MVGSGFDFILCPNRTTLINESDGKVENNEMDKRNENRISVRNRNEQRPITIHKGKSGTGKKKTLMTQNGKSWSGITWLRVAGSLLSSFCLFHCFLLSAVGHISQTGHGGANLQKEPRNNGT